MTLKIRRIKLQRFRNYEDFELDDIGEMTIFVGANAAGKTNIIEGIQLLTALGSFRNSRSIELIKHGSKDARASISVTDGNRDLEVSLYLEEGKKSYLLNGKRKRTKDLKGLVPAVIFTPDELNLVKGPDSGRRAELDSIGTQLNANYYQILKDFEKVLHHKNRLLKDEAPSELIEAMNEMFAKVGTRLTNYRRALFERLMPYVAAAYQRISGGKEELTGAYLPSWETQSDGTPSSQRDPQQDRAEEETLLVAALERLYDQEMMRRRTLVGPHLDKIVLALDGLDASLYASQGQQRSIVLALKLAEAELIEEMMDQLPLLLLDDVMSELDASRRTALVDYLSHGKQAFITTANLNYFDKRMRDTAQIVEIEKQL